MENPNLWRRLTLNGLSSLMEWHNRFLLFHKQLCSPIDHHHILIKYWRLFVIPIILHVQSSKITTTTKNNCQGAGVSDQLGGDSGVIGSSRPGFFRSLINQFFHLLFIVLSDPGFYDYLKKSLFLILPIVFLLLSNPAGQDWAASKPYRDGESVCTGVYDEGGVEGDESSLMTFNTIL